MLLLLESLTRVLRFFRKTNSTVRRCEIGSAEVTSVTVSEGKLVETVATALVVVTLIVTTAR